jgi:AcrR family transcriptional regulator
MALTIARPTKQQERAERSTKALLDAAASLIVEGGFASLTFAAIGDRAGYSRGLVSARFGSKEGLVEELIDRIVTTWNHRTVLPHTRGKPGLDGFGVLLDAIRQQAEADPRGLRVLYALMFEALGPDEELRTRFAKFHETMRADFARLITKGQTDGSIRRGLGAAREAALVVGGLRGIGYQWLLDPEHFDLVGALAYLHDTTTARLANR